MAERRPLCLVAGIIAELPAGDTLPGTCDYLSTNAQAVGSITGSVSLSTGDMGKAHVVAAGASDYTITLPASVTQGNKVAFYVNIPPGGMKDTKQYTVKPATGEYIAGRAVDQGMVLLASNVLILESAGGGAWWIIGQKLDTDWVNAGAMTLTAVTTNPTKGGGTTYDRVYFRRAGHDLLCRYEYRQTTAGTAGSGDYLWAVPIGTIDTGLVTAETGAGSAHTRATAGIGSGKYDAGGTLIEVTASVYNTTRMRFDGANANGANGGFIGSSYASLGSAAVRFHVNTCTPMTDW